MLKGERTEPSERPVVSATRYLVSGVLEVRIYWAGQEADRVYRQWMVYSGGRDGERG
jgi:hypothetical protein